MDFCDAAAEHAFRAAALCHNPHVLEQLQAAGIAYRLVATDVDVLRPLGLDAECRAVLATIFKAIPDAGDMPLWLSA
jgi:hypothetical protein